MRLAFAGVIAAFLGGCSSNPDETEAQSGPRWADWAAAVGNAARAELSRPANDCQRENRDPAWVDAGDAMNERDQRARSGRVSAEEWRDLDRQNREDLAALVSERGWPVPCDLTRSAARGVFYVVQHHNDPERRREALPYLEAMAEQGQITRSDFALLVDRVLLQSGAPQRFGTQYICRDGVYVRNMTADLDGLDERRTSMDLMPAAMELRLVNRNNETDRCRAN